MKTNRSFGLIILAASTIVLTASAQDDQREKRAKDIGDRIGTEVERFVNRFTQRWDARVEDDASVQDTSQRRVRQAVDWEDLESESDTHTYSTATLVADSEVVNGNIVVKGADLTVAGKVDGDVVVVGGNLRVRDRGVITGNARVINGDIIKDDGATIEGYEDRTSAQSTRYREPRRRFTHGATSFDVPWLTESTSYENVLFRYNRVEGLFLGLGTEKKYYWEGQRHWNAYGSVGYGFKSHAWRGNLGLARQFALRNSDGHELLELGVEGYSLTDTKDQWIIHPMENTLAALLMHEDFRDYFKREGYTVHVAYYSARDNFRSEASVAYSADRYDSLSNKVDWALFGGDKRFRVNPAIQPDRIHNITGSLGLNTVTRYSGGDEGWNITATAEFAKRSYGGDAEFDRYILDLRRFQPLGRYENFNIRVRGGSASGVLPQQRVFDMGGLGTLNAFPFKSQPRNSQPRNRMLLMNAELVLNGAALDDLEFWPTWLFRHFNFLLLSDAGFTRSVPTRLDPNEGFDGVTWKEFRHDVGIALSNRTGSFRIGVAWRTDVAAPVQFILRVNRPF